MSPPPRLGNPNMFAQCLDFLEANRALAPSLVLEFKQSTFRNLGSVGNRTSGCAGAARLSFLDRSRPRSADRAARTRRSRRSLHQGAGELCCSTNGRRRRPISMPSDLSDLLGRFGIDLIAERIEGERAVVDLLDYDVRFGQGFLFAALQAVAAGDGAHLPGDAAASLETRQQRFPMVQSRLLPSKPDSQRADRFAAQRPATQRWARRASRARLDPVTASDDRHSDLPRRLRELVEARRRHAERHMGRRSQRPRRVSRRLRSPAQRSGRRAAPSFSVTNAPRPADSVQRQLRKLNVPDDTYDAIVSSGDLTREFRRGSSRRGQSSGSVRNADNSIVPGPRCRRSRRWSSSDYIICTGPVR